MCSWSSPLEHINSVHFKWLNMFSLPHSNAPFALPLAISAPRARDSKYMYNNIITICHKWRRLHLVGCSYSQKIIHILNVMTTKSFQFAVFFFISFQCSGLLFLHCYVCVVRLCCAECVPMPNGNSGINEFPWIYILKSFRKASHNSEYYYYHYKCKCTVNRKDGLRARDELLN